MPGIGKTTLAQYVLKDEKVVRNFDVRVWSGVSVEFDQCRIFKRIIEKLTGSCHVQDPDLIQEKLLSELRNKKFLIILDDLWEERIWVLEKFWVPFIEAAPGSKFIITTQNENIAESLKTVERSVILKPMSNEDCWSLICSHARWDTNTRPELIQLEREILQICAGSPLAAAIMGGMLRGKDKEFEWKSILEDDSWKSKGKSEIGSVLMMSIRRLPHSLKGCFSFCTMLCAGNKFYKLCLVDLWIASGLIKWRKPVKERKDLEDLGSSYLDELKSRNLLSCVDDYYVMHDLIRDLGNKICGIRCCKWEKELGSWEKTRHLIIDKSMITKLLHGLQFFEKKVLPWRTLIIGGGNYKMQCNFHDLFAKLGRLRVLHLEDFKITKFPTSFGQMKHLRYLHIGYCADLKELPSEIGNFHKLSTLILCNCTGLTKLPSQIGRLENLCRLDIEGCTGLLKLPPELGKLSNLWRFNIVGCTSLTELPPELGKQSSLSQLGIMDCPRLTGLPPELGNLSSLTELCIDGCTGLRGLPSELKKLTKLSLFIKGCPKLTESASTLSGN